MKYYTIMKQILIFSIVLLLITSCYSLGSILKPKVTKSDVVARTLQQTTFSYIENTLFTYPQLATQTGMHIKKIITGTIMRLDRELPNYSEEFIEIRIQALINHLNTLNTEVPVELLSINDIADRQLLIDAINYEIFQFSQQQIHKSNPLVHTVALAEALYYPMVIKYADESKRMSDVLSRIYLIPSFLDRATRILTSSSNVYNQPAAEINLWIINLIKNDIRNKIRGDTTLLENYNKNVPAVLAALNDFQKFLTTDLPAKSTTSWILGENTYDEHFAMLFHGQVDSFNMTHVAQQKVKSIRLEMFKLAKPFYCKENPADKEICQKQDEQKIAEDETTDESETLNSETLNSETLNSETIDKVLKYTLGVINRSKPAANRPLARLKKQIAQTSKNCTFVTAIDTNKLIIEAMPAFLFAKQNVFAFASSPAFEPDLEAHLYLTTDAKTSPLTDLSIERMSFTGASEYIQFVAFDNAVKIEKQTRRALRMLKFDAAYVDGLKLYFANIMANKQTGDNAWKHQFVSLAFQLEAAVGFIVDIGLHKNGMSEKDAIDKYKNQAFASAAFAKNKVEMIKISPLKLAGAFIGLFQWNELSDQLKAKNGNEFDLEKMINTYLKYGPVPLKELYKIITGNPDEMPESDEVVEEAQKGNVSIVDVIKY